MSKLRIGLPLRLLLGGFVKEAHGSAFLIDLNEYQTLYQIGYTSNISGMKKSSF